MPRNSSKSTYSSNDMTKVILSGPAVFSNEKSAPFYEFGAVLISEGKILQVGSIESIVKDNPLIPIENLGNGLLTPGLVNLHHHLYSSFARGWEPPGTPATDFKETLERIWWRLDEGLQLDDIYYSALIGLCESVLSGVTSVVDHHSSQRTVTNSLDRIGAAFTMAGLRGSVCFELSDRAGQRIFEASLKETATALGRWPLDAKDKMLTAMVGIHASMTLSDENLKKISESFKIYSPGFHFHLAEDEIDQKISMENYGMRAAHRFAKHGLLNEKSLAIHGVHIDKDEIEILKSSGTNLALCARSNQNNAVGFADWWDYEGLSIGIGTDGIGSDILQEAKSALYLSRHQKKEPSFGFGEIGKMILESNPNIFEKIASTKVGRIAPGYPADLVFWRYNPPTPMDGTNIMGHYLYGLCNQQADSVWVNGKRILADGRFTQFDYDDMLKEAKTLAKSLWERI
jgi:putative selenium metabolism protein SsnA